MEFLAPGLITVFTLLCVGLSTVLSLGVAGFFIYRIFKSMSGNNAVLKTGVSAPAVILNVEDTGVTMNNSPQARLMLQVTPAGRPPFQAVATTFVGRMQIGMITPGASVTVRYDPNDISKVAIESIGAPGMGGMGSANVAAVQSANVAAVQSAMLAQDQYYNELRQRGEEAKAMILTVQDMNIRVEGGGSMFRMTFEVTPRVGDPFKAETQAAIGDSAREKYSVGKMVYVRYDPSNKAQVALDRAA
jgi:hypothetical protein